MGAVRPQTPHRSPRQAFGGNISKGRFAPSTTPHVKLNASRSCFIVLTKPGFIAGVMVSSWERETTN
jgi:hypothetical protein